MWGLTHYGNASDFEWDVITGISAGSVNTAASAAFTPKQGQYMTEFLSQGWNATNTSDVYKMWNNPVMGITFYGGAVDDSPMLETMEHLLEIVPIDDF